MAKKVSSRRELLERWRGIEEKEEETDDTDPSVRRSLHKRKEEWFRFSFFSLSYFLVQLLQNIYFYYSFY